MNILKTAIVTSLIIISLTFSAHAETIIEIDESTGVTYSINDKKFVGINGNNINNTISIDSSSGNVIINGQNVTKHLKNSKFKELLKQLKALILTATNMQSGQIRVLEERLD